MTLKSHAGDGPAAAGCPVSNPDNNRPFAQLLSGLETGHPAAAGPSPAYDFSVFDERNAVFLVSVLDCVSFLGVFSLSLDHLNSSWSIARLREYFRRKIGHS